jgi:GT2 family glycosyltransferase
MKVSVVILNWNGGADNCLECVESALAQDYFDKEIIFVDNASSDGSYDAVRSRYPDLIYIQTGSNLGCPAGRNVGAKAASGELIFFLENDGVWPQADLISKVVSLFSENPRIGAIYTSVEGYQSGIKDAPVDRAKIPLDSDHLYLSSTFRGGASVVRSDIFSRIGMFPDDFFRQHEEILVSLLMYDAGFDVVYYPSLRMRHKGSDYSGKSESVISYNIINDLKIVARSYPKIIWRFIFIIKLIKSLIRVSRSRYRTLLPDLALKIATTRFTNPNSHRISWRVMHRNMRMRRSHTPILYIPKNTWQRSRYHQIGITHSALQPTNNSTLRDLQ